MSRNDKNIFLFILCLSFLSAGFGQGNNRQIKTIRKQFQTINNDHTLKMIVLENEEFLTNMTDGGGKLTGFYKGTEIKKIYEWIGLSNGISIKEFYFDKGELIFVYEKFSSFIYDDKEDKVDHTKTKTIFEGRYYFTDKKLLSKSMKGDKSETAQDESTATTLLDRANEHLRLLTKKIH